jgi:hypothetical protein
MRRASATHARSRRISTSSKRQIQPKSFELYRTDRAVQLLGDPLDVYNSGQPDERVDFFLSPQSFGSPVIGGDADGDRVIRSHFVCIPLVLNADRRHLRFEALFGNAVGYAILGLAAFNPSLAD